MYVVNINFGFEVEGVILVEFDSYLFFIIVVDVSSFKYFEELFGCVVVVGCDVVFVSYVGVLDDIGFVCGGWEVNGCGGFGWGSYISVDDV